ncbi:MAG: hypothetical protein ACK56F_19375 [bacterium]
MKDSGLMTKDMGWEISNMQMAINLMELGSKTRNTDKEFFIMLIMMFMKEPSATTKRKD